MVFRVRMVVSRLCSFAGGWIHGPQAHNTPYGHDRVENHRRPQGDADKSQADAGQSEDESRTEVIEHHRADQSSRGAGLLVITHKPRSDAEREQRHPGYATERDACAGDLGIEQEPDDDSGHGDQPQSRGRFDDSGEFKQTVHGVWGRKAGGFFGPPDSRISGELGVSYSWPGRLVPPRPSSDP